MTPLTKLSLVNYDFDKLFMDLYNPSPNAKILYTYFFRHELSTIE